MQPDLANTILVVDDEPLVAEVLMQALREGLGPTIAAVTTEHALALLEASRFRLAVVDVVLPHRSGVELGEIAVGLGTPVMLISGDFDVVAALRRYGFPFVMQKPMRMTTLVREAQMAILQGVDACWAYGLAAEVMATHASVGRGC
jgi:DNA-binding NtrC family response regulator